MFIWDQASPEAKKEALNRPATADNAQIQTAVSGIIADVAQNGDKALLALTEKFDGVKLQSISLDVAALQSIASRINSQVKTAIDVAYNNIRIFHEKQQYQSISTQTSQGVTCELHYAPLDAVGLYIPGGTAPLPSTVLMVGVAAQVAGCPTRILCTPPNASGEIHPAIAYAASLCGINEVNLVGGAQAIAAMALGTDSVSRADKIFGPGNAFVTEAKQQVSVLPGGPAIDMPAGPSEVLVIADELADPAFVAADLLSQAEHGEDSQAILVSNSQQQIEATKHCVTEQLAALGRQTIATAAMQNARYILTSSVAESVAVSNQYAPEHLIVQTQDPRGLLPSLKNAGSIFLGKWSPESAGDYASGTNHVLPTYGYARNYSSLGVADFYRRYTVQELSSEGLQNIGQAIMDLADAEGLDAHKNAVALRLASLSVDENTADEPGAAK